MKRDLVDYLCDPVDKSPLRIEDEVTDAAEHVVSGRLVSQSGRTYKIRDGIPRFVPDAGAANAVRSFGDEWNYFNFDHYKLNWLNHTVRNTFGSTAAFAGKLVVDAGAGSGMQSRWMREAGARRVIALELSHAVDGIMRRNFAGLDGIDIVQCSIDHPPLKDASIDGMVICHNVIQHTPSVEATARALWALVAPGGELVFNCYLKNDFNALRRFRFWFYQRLRQHLSRTSFGFLLWYARTMAVLRFVPILGLVLERLCFVVRGEVPAGKQWLRRAYRLAVLNTFDWYGAHEHQHHKTREEIDSLVKELQPDASKVCNLQSYLKLPAPPIGCAIRLER
jgi:SAM-dependent methyltransferase